MVRFQPLFSGGNEPDFPDPAPGASPTPDRRAVRGGGKRGTEAELATGLGKRCQKRDRGNFLWGGGFVCV